MDSPTETVATPSAPSNRYRRWKRLGVVLFTVLATYLLIAYLLIPLVWEGYARRHPAFDDDPRITQTRDGHPGDPLNVALIGTQAEVEQIMAAAKWNAAAALGLRSDEKIAVDTVLKRPDDDAPVSSLYLFGRKQDLAFEQPVGDSPRKRNHVRFWRTGKNDPDGRPVWIGSASYDERVGFSHTTGQVTHHIAPDVDTERDHLFADLKATGQLSETYSIPKFHTQLEGKNGEGDPWRTDGALEAGVIAAP